MAPRVLVTGAGGMLGRDVVRTFTPHATVVAFGHAQLDISDARACTRIIGEYKPDVVINCAAFTNVDLCETQRQAAYRINADGPRNLAAGCAETGSLLVHISTDYVFRGNAEFPYREDDPVEPVNVYGASKLEGEKQIRLSGAPHLIVRTAWLYGKGGPNFVKTILSLAGERETLRVVDDQRGSPTYTADLALGLLTLVQVAARGTVHLTNQGSCTWFEFARRALMYAGENPEKVLPVATEQFPRPAKRPVRSVLDNSRFEQLTGGLLRHWKEALRAYLQ